MKRRKSLIAGITVLAILVLAYGGCNIYRFPGALRGLSNNALDDMQVEKLREEILSQADKKVRVAYFSYSGTTRSIADAISEKNGGDLFEITPQAGYSDV